MFGWGMPGDHGGGDGRFMAKEVRYDWAQAGRDVALLLALREARQRVLAALAEAAEDGEAFARLVQAQRDMVLLVAEFFFALKAMEIAAPAALAAFVASHNRHLDQRIEGEFKNKAGGLADRLREGKFGAGAIRMIELTRAEQGRIELSQSDIARFLVEVMSDETCRKVLAGLAEAGLLKTRREPINRAVMVWSEGVLEAAFGRHLADLRAIVAAQA